MTWCTRGRGASELQARVDQRLDRPTFPMVDTDIQWVLLELVWRRYASSRRLDMVFVVCGVEGLFLCRDC